MIPAKLKEEIDRWMSEGKYGHLQINFANGKIVNVNRVESIRLEVTTTLISPTTLNDSGVAKPGSNGSLA